MKKFRIYADFNGLQSSPATEGLYALFLHYFGSLKDLSRHQVSLQEGMILDVYSDSDVNEDLEATGVVRFDAPTKQWYVEFAKEEIRYVPTPNGAYEQAFPCWHCQEDLRNQISAQGLKLGDICNKCGFVIHSPLGAPGGKGHSGA